MPKELTDVVTIGVVTGEKFTIKEVDMNRGTQVIEGLGVTGQYYEITRAHIVYMRRHKIKC